jgi:2Fe-2S ferredoxin
MNVYTIQFDFEEPGLEPRTVQAVEGESILDICEANDIHLNHNCGGVCACSTCHVYITNGMEHLPEITDKEEDFIDRAVNPTVDSRLGCQCLIQGPVSVLVPDQRHIIGHEH